MRTLLFCAISILLAPPARACTPRSEALLAWDLSKDLAVVGFWPERDRAPSGVPPGGFELRRISTGEQIANHDCQYGPPLPCQYQAALARSLPADARWRTRGTPPPRTLRLKPTASRAAREVALETKGARGWQRLLWLQVIPAADQEWRDYRWLGHDVHDGEVMLAFEVLARTGACGYSTVRAFRVPRADLGDPRRAGRQAELLARPRRDEAFEHWRTIAELGPVPADRLVEALEAAENDGQPAFGLRWWKDSTRGLPPEKVARLIEAVRKNEALFRTRPLVLPGGGGGRR